MNPIDEIVGEFFEDQSLALDHSFGSFLTTDIFLKKNPPEPTLVLHSNIESPECKLQLNDLLILFRGS